MTLQERMQSVLALVATPPNYDFTFADLTIRKRPAGQTMIVCPHPNTLM